MKGNNATRLRAPFLRFVVLCILAVFLPISAEASDDQQNYTVHGLPLKVSVVADKQEIMIGEPTFLTYSVMNESDQDLYLFTGVGHHCAVSIANETGDVLPSPDYGISEYNGFSGPQPFPRKGRHEESSLLSHWGAITKPGIYTITVKRTLRLHGGENGYNHNEPSFDLPTEVKTKIRVIAADSQHMGALIQAWGEKALKKTGKGLVEIASIHDERAIPYLAQLAESRDYSTRITALDALGKYETDEALAILEKNLAVTGRDVGNCKTEQVAESLANNIQAVAAHGLRESNSSKAHGILLAHIHDALPEIRLTAVHLLGSMKTDDAASLLHQMTNDPNDSVRGEANRYLIEMKR